MVQIMVLARSLKRLANAFMRPWYTFINRSDSDGVLHFMNYGYQGDELVDLHDADQQERYPIQLYHHVASATELQDRDVLEIGCGRGGGLSYLHRYMKPRSATGVDLNADAVAFCRSSYPGISFMTMDAQRLDFPDASFDAVVNVESSHRYPDFAAFVAEVHRVLRPGGHFLFTDFRYAGLVEAMVDQIAASGFRTIRFEVINKEVTTALREDAERRVALIRRYLPRGLHGTALEFAGNPGTRLYRSFELQRRVYVCIALIKERDASEY